MKKDIRTKLKRVSWIFLVILLFSCFNFGFNFSNVKNCDFVNSESLMLSESEILNLSSYDSRDYGLVTDVKDQGDSSLCWAYSAISASETSILKSGIDKNVTKDTLSLSPTSIGYGRYNRPADPLNNVVGEASGGNWLTDSGESSYAGILMSQWWGPISGTSSASTNAYENNLYKLKNMVKIYDDNTFYDFDTRISEMKKAIAKYGAITFSYNNLRETEYYNPKRETGDKYFLHACTIIGWNDNISASNFVPSGTVKNGGWLVKNSYSSLPYFWLSYECVSSNIYAFDFSSKDEYDFNYFYDDSLAGGWTEDLKTQYVANVYEAKKSTLTEDECLKAVNVAFACRNTTVTVDVYTDLNDSSNPESGVLMATKKQTFEQSGYRTIELDAPVKIKNGEKFSIVVQLSSTSSSSPYVSTAQGKGLCYRKKNGQWSKIENNVLRIKGYTVLSEKQDEKPLIVDIQDAIVSSIPNFVYTGDEIKPTIEITYDGNALIEDEDYVISYSNNVNASSLAKIKIIGKGNFDGEREMFFTIIQAEKPNISIPETIDNLQNHKILNQINLPSGFVWKNPDFELVNGTNNVAIVYNNPDKDNFKITEFNVQVNYNEVVEPNIPEDNPDDDTKDEDVEENPSENENVSDKNDANKEKNDESLSDLGFVFIIVGGCFGGLISAGAYFLVRKLKKRHKN